MTAPVVSQVSPMLAAISIAAIGLGALVLVLPPRVRRIGSALLVALLLGAGVAVAQEFSPQMVVDGLECCEGWWVYLWICIPLC